MLNFFLVGSCVSADPFYILKPTNARLQNYYARTSFGSAFSSSQFCLTLVEIENGNPIASDWQRKMVSNDHSKTLINDMVSESENFDYFLVDFIDERFSQIICQDTVATYSMAFQAAFDPSERQQVVQLVESGSDAHFKNFCDGFSLFVEKASELGKPILINKVFWGKGDGNKQFYSDNMIRKANTYLERLYQFADAKNCEFISYENYPECMDNTGDLLLDPDHKWGLAPFHFNTRIYEKMLEHLSKQD